MFILKMNFRSGFINKGEQVGIRRVDFFVEKAIPVEIKTATEFSDLNIAQAKNYLEAGGIEIRVTYKFWSFKFAVQKNDL